MLSKELDEDKLEYGLKECVTCKSGLDKAIAIELHAELTAVSAALNNIKSLLVQGEDIICDKY